MRDAYFPFHALGFRSNPFRALTDEEWAGIVVLPEAVARAAAQRGHLQILGELGHGKTSSLLGLAAQLRQEGRRAAYEYLPIGQQAFTTLLAGQDVFLLDETQRLRLPERRRLLAAASADLRLILGSHEDLTTLFDKAHLLLATVQLGAPDLAQLSAILTRRLEYFALESGRPGVSLDPSAMQFMSGTFGGNLRQMERFLYEVFQSLTAPGVLSAQDLEAQVALLGGAKNR